MVVGIVLAAGAGTRFGGRKQLAELDGRPLLEHALEAMESAPVAERIVVLGADADEVRAGVDLHGARTVVCDYWAEGQSASLRAGLDAAGDDADAVVVTLGDQPHIATRAIAAVVAARGNGAQAVRATYSGAPGHPVLIERELFAALHQLTGDEGARVVLQGARVTEVVCDGLGKPDDVDTPDQLAP
jgi:CTP:molybdopterin cytidylyltransferase MocA